MKDNTSATDDLGEPSAPIENQNSKIQNPSRPRSKIAQLPKKLRDLINQSLDDGATYAQVVQRLNESTDPPLPHAISERNISDWHRAGYQDYLRHQDHLEILSAKFDFALDLAQKSQPEKLQELCLQLAAIRMCEFLSETAIADPKTNPANYLRLLSALPRISKEALNLQKYRDASIKAQKTGIPADNLTPEERAEAARTALLDKFDDIMGLKSYRNLPTLVPHPSQQPSSPPEPVPQSKIKNQNSKIPETETCGNLQKPNPAPELGREGSSQPAAPESCPPDGSPITPFASEQSKIKIQNSKIPKTETSGNLQKPNPAPVAPINTHADQSKIQNQNSKISNACALCGNRPASFVVQPFPHECQLCPMCPTPPPSASAFSPAPDPALAAVSQSNGQ